jgi:uncharacterized membrane protein
MNNPIKSGVSIATAAALLALSSAASFATPSFAAAAEKDEPGRCYGVNTCKGQSLCATAKHDCKGLNNCKGEGVIVLPKSECLAKGGTLTEPK